MPRYIQQPIRNHCPTLRGPAGIASACWISAAASPMISGMVAHAMTALSSRPSHCQIVESGFAITIGAKNLRKHHTAVGLLVRFQQANEDPRQRQARAVER